MLEIGSLVDGKYKVLSVIGRGGMSTVYLAINEKANKPWAIKEVKKDGVQDFEVVRQSLMVEIDMLKKLSHKGLPSIIDVIDNDEDFLIVMDYIEGNTLKSLIREQGAQKQEDVVKWAMQLCDVLSYLHERPQPIIYRDMKPANVMLGSDGNVTLIDFGTAREYKDRNLEDTTCLGTQGYAAPEQFGGKGQTDARTDIYCLGATMYHLVTGHNPSDPPYEMYPITKWNKNLSTGLEQIILKCTQKNPQDRYQSARELMYDLEHYRDYDISALKVYKRHLVICVSTFIAAFLFLFAACITGFIATKERGNEYQYLVDVADKAVTEDDTVSYYLQAISTDCTREDAYQKLVEKYMEDGMFTEDEEASLIQLNISVNKYLTKFAESNKAGYAEFCYQVGILYWYYYEHEETRQTNAVKWFQSSLDYYETAKDKDIERKRCKIYIDIGTFYKKILQAQVEGNDNGMYTEYWNDLLELKRMNDEEPDREMITLRLYKEIASRIAEYARYLLEEGITRAELEQVLISISNDMDAMELQAGNSVKNEISQIRVILSNAQDMVISSDR